MQRYNNVTRRPRNKKRFGSPTPLQQFNDLLRHETDLDELLREVHDHCTHFTYPENWDSDIQQALFFTAELARIIKLMLGDRLLEQLEREKVLNN